MKLMLDRRDEDVQLESISSQITFLTCIFWAIFCALIIIGILMGITYMRVLHIDKFFADNYDDSYIVTK